MIDLDAAFMEVAPDSVGQEYLRYQRTARRITSGGKRNPANVE